jgi:hypothetical protein
MRASVGLVTAALLALAGCAVSTEPSETDGVSSGLAAGDYAKATNWELPVPEIKTVGGRLRSGFANSAREIVCVNYDADLDVVAIDEFECTNVRDPLAKHGTAQLCGSCRMVIQPAANGSLLLSARHDRGCEQFAGTYLLSRRYTKMACTEPPPEAIVMVPRCEYDGSRLTKCALPPSPAIEDQNAEPY